MDEHDWLVEYVRTGSQAAFARLAERYVDLVYSAAMRQVHDPHAAQDVSQGVFVLLARKAPALAKSRVPLAGWLIKATRWVSLNALREQARRRKHEQKAAAMTSEIGDEPEDARQIWDELKPHLDAALAKLGDLDRSAVVMRYMQRRSLREVGEALGVSEDAAKQRVFRAIGKLRSLLSKNAGTCLPAAAGLTAVIAARAVQAAPAGMLQTATAVATGAGASGVQAAGLLKGTGWVMMATKTKVTLVAAAVAILVGTPAAIVATHRALAPAAMAMAADPAPAKPANTKADAPAGDDWHARFNAAYAPGADESLRRIPRPFSAERKQYMAEVNRGGGITMPDSGIFVFRSDRGQVSWNRWTAQEGTVGNVLRFVCQVPSYRLVLDEFDRMRRIDGDWVIRSGASEDDLVQSAFTIVRREMNWPVIVQKKKVEREVFVARGTWKLTSPRPTPGEPPLLRIYLDKPGKIDNHAAGDVHELFTTLGEIMETEVVNETQGTEKQSVFWCNNASGGVAAEFRAKLLAHITEQTGLTFTLERRKMDTWVTQQE